MIKSFLIINFQGRNRFCRFYGPNSPTGTNAEAFIKKVFGVLTKSGTTSGNYLPFDDNLTLVFNKFSSCYFCFVIDEYESELGMMDIIIVILDTFERVFKKCREIDIKLNPEKVNLIIDQIICNGTVISINADEIVDNYEKLTAKNDFVSQTLGSLGSMGGKLPSLSGWLKFGKGSS